jgi:hypothetical protein
MARRFGNGPPGASPAPGEEIIITSDDQVPEVLKLQYHLIKDLLGAYFNEYEIIIAYDFDNAPKPYEVEGTVKSLSQAIVMWLDIDTPEQLNVSFAHTHQFYAAGSQITAWSLCDPDIKPKILTWFKELNDGGRLRAFPVIR